MLDKVCYWHFCFTPVSTSGHSERIFGFSEYLTAVALLALLFTITDYRYKFRLAITPGRLYRNSYILLATIGVLSLLTEVWIAEDWYVPVTIGIDYNIWQLLLGLLFLTTFLTWMYYAFINPPIFNKRNARRYANTLYWAVVKGSDDELKIIADELSWSANALINYVEQFTERSEKEKVLDYKAYAHDILLIIGNRRLCKHIVATSPVTAQAFFEAMTSSKKFDIPIGQFARSITTEAISQKESFLYGEAEDGAYSGLLGYLKPVSKALYGDFNLLEALANTGLSPVEAHYDERYKWDASQWGAYCRAALITIKNYLDAHQNSRSIRSISSVISALEGASSDIYKLDGLDSIYETETFKKFSVVTRFVNQAIELINVHPTPPEPLYRVKEDRYPKDIYDYLANLIFELCYQAAGVKSPRNNAWQVHYSTVWSQFFGFQTGPAWKIIRYKVRRLLYDEISSLDERPNYRNTRVLGFCLNILFDATKPTKENNYWRPSYPLAKYVQNWVRENYLQLRKTNSELGDSVLIGSLSFDESGRRLVKTYIKGLRKEEPKTYIQLKALRRARRPVVK